MSLHDAQWAKGKYVCVGLDPVYTRLEKAYPATKPRPVMLAAHFLRQIVDATSDIAHAFKPNRAFYRDEAGVRLLKSTIEHIHNFAPEVPVILDHKYGDIGESNKGYIEEAFDIYGADAVTVHGYLGSGTWRDLLERPDKGIFVLCRTSNEDARRMQERLTVVEAKEMEEFYGLEIGEAAYKYGWTVDTSHSPIRVEMPYYEFMALDVAHSWNKFGNCGLVVGATIPHALERVRAIAPDIPILGPGFGSQGGKPEEAVPRMRHRFLANGSSSLMYAFEKRGGDFAEAARRETQKLHDQITSALG